MRRACRLAVAVQICLLIAVASLALASPADPAWIPGIYDLADFDDVLYLLLDDAAGVVGAAPAAEAALQSAARATDTQPASAVGCGALDGARLRSPPVAWPPLDSIITVARPPVAARAP